MEQLFLTIKIIHLANSKIGPSMESGEKTETNHPVSRSCIFYALQNESGQKYRRKVIYCFLTDGSEDYG